MGNNIKKRKSLGNGFFSLLKEGKLNVVNNNGVEICPPKYSSISEFCKGLARVEINAKFGFINEKGDEVIKCFYVSATDFKNGLSYVSINGRDSFYIDENNETITDQRRINNFLNKYNPDEIYQTPDTIKNIGQIIV